MSRCRRSEPRTASVEWRTIRYEDATPAQRQAWNRLWTGLLTPRPETQCVTDQTPADQDEGTSTDIEAFPKTRKGGARVRTSPENHTD
jgi:hypothetical protein